MKPAGSVVSTIDQGAVWNQVKVRLMPIGCRWSISHGKPFWRAMWRRPKAAAKDPRAFWGAIPLAPGEGMWIVPCEAIHTFFMRFAIDLVYLDRKNRVKKVASSVRPWRLSACLSAYSVLELPVGTVQNSQSCPGDLIEFSPVQDPSDASRL